LGVGAGWDRPILVMSRLRVEMEVPFNAFRHLPPNAVAELTDLVERLVALHPNTKIDWSDSWSDEDLSEVTAASMRRFEAEELEEEGH
jgi:hypothetical protein